MIIDSSDAFVAADRLRAGSRTAIRAVERTVRLETAWATGKVKAFASGRPGPRVRTGDYRRSINMRMITRQHGVIGTNAPQARRLEFGFVGRDSLGRFYDQAPLPHWRPMEWIMRTRFPNAVARAVSEAHRRA